MSTGIGNILNSPLRIGNLQVPNRVFLAPLAGVSDVPFRRICQHMGAGLSYVEMLSATAIKYQNRRTFEMMARHPSEKVLGVQVTGPTSEDVAHAVEVLCNKGFETIDINMGCPVKKVVNAGCGSGFLKDQNRLRETIARAKETSRVPLSIKYRLGYTRPEFNVEETTRNGVSLGVDMVTIHGRTRSESYDTPVDLEGIRKAFSEAENVSESLGKNRIPVVGNGDVFCHSSAAKMIFETGVDAVMVSRGALGNPWVFAEILSQKTVQPTLSEWHELVCQHIAWHQEHYGHTRAAAVLMRKHLLWYSKGFPGTKSLREFFNTVECLDAAHEKLAEFSSRHSGSLVRFGSERIEAGYDPKFEMDRESDRGVGHLDLS